MKRWIGFLAFALSSLTACQTVQGIKPIYPEVGNPNIPAKVDSLQPTFRWDPPSDVNASYDLIIYEVLNPGTFWQRASRRPGRMVYYRQAIKDTSHTVEETLKPNTEYYWSIRLRQGDKVSPWSTYDHAMFVPVPFGFIHERGTSLLFLFKTPDK